MLTRSSLGLSYEERPNPSGEHSGLELVPKLRSVGKTMHLILASYDEKRQTSVIWRHITVLRNYHPT